MTDSTIGKRTYKVRVRKVVEIQVEVSPGDAPTRERAKALAEDQIRDAHNGDGELISVTGYPKWAEH